MTERKKREIKELMRQMKEPDPSHDWFCAGTVMWGSQLLVLKYYPHYIEKPDEYQIKFPGGKWKRDPSRGRGDKTPEDTFFAEMKEEVLGGKGHVDEYVPITVIETRSGHKKFFCLFEPEGRLRNNDLFEEREETEKGEVTRERLSPPYFEQVEVLERILFPGHKIFLLELARVYSSTTPYGDVTKRLEIQAAHGDFPTYGLV